MDDEAASAEFDSYLQLGINFEDAIAIISKEKTLQEVLGTSACNTAESSILPNNIFQLQQNFISEMKQTLVINNNLNMSTGKIAAQCVHASLGALDSVSPSDLTSWRNSGEKVVCLKLGDKSFKNLVATANANNTPCFLVHDAGRTEVDPGTATVLAIGPTQSHLVDEVTGELLLY